MFIKGTLSGHYQIKNWNLNEAELLVHMFKQKLHKCISVWQATFNKI